MSPPGNNPQRVCELAAVKGGETEPSNEICTL